MSEITFLGHNISADGIKPDYRKVTAIRNMPEPTNKQELQRFLGMINYLGKFIPNLAQKTTPLRNLLKKDIVFALEKPQRDAIAELKEIVTSHPVLKFYDPNLPLRLRTDASTDGLGGMLEQKMGDQWHPIAFASRSLTSAERNYSAIESETLSIVFGCERFHDYVYGRPFQVVNDHLPLKSIFNKSITSCPPRIQRSFLRLQRYDFVLEHTSGKNMVVADTLSRASLPSTLGEIPSDDMNFYVHSVVMNLQISSKRMKQFQLETSQDVDLQKLKEYTEKGWPGKEKIDASVSPYKNYQDEISYHNGVLLKGNRIIVPSSMRLEMKTLIHQGHLGTEKCLNRARGSLFWPGMTRDLTNMVLNCSTCLDHRNKQRHETMISHDIPAFPWEKVGVDLFDLYGNEYVIVVDYSTKFVEVALLRNESSKCVIDNLKKIFSRHGIPKEVFSDNGSQFSSQKFRKFSSSWDFAHSTSSPEYPQSNGLVERHVQTVKQLMKKSKQSRGDPYLAMLNLNTTINKDGLSPASLMFGRHPRTTLPSLMEDQPQRKVEVKGKTRMLYNRNKKDMPSIPPSTTVRILSKRKNEKWKKKGMVVSKRSEPRSYNVLNEKGNVVRRNRYQLIPTKEHFELDIDYDDLLQSNVDPERIQSNEAQNEHQEQIQQANDDDYRTRSGRISRKPDRYGI